MGDRTLLIPLSVVISVAENLFCGRLGWAVADGAEQESGHVLCVHVLAGTPLPCRGCSHVAGVCAGGEPTLPPQPIPSDQVSVCTEPPSHRSLKPST